MKANETPKIKSDEAGFTISLVIILFLIVPALPLGKYGGGLAMVAVSIVGMAAYLVLFGERLRSRGQLKTASITAAVSALMAASIAFALPLIRGYWHSFLQ